ncbi:type II toxin-antitoxin system HicB family antitoxin [Pedobacter sp. AW31-3R]|uniref:type II toxin-antitoxin system HicB family antitoxin n=1 Tax=Pedobacter sp. AW31-3R TaxID=3445781 RepID=UPI003FA02D5E
MNDILQYKNYHGSVHFSAADEVFHGKILAINDLVSFEGASVSELKLAFQEAVEDYLETCLKIGKAPEKTYRGTFNVRVPSALHKQASLFAAIHNITLNEFVKTALTYTLKHQEQFNQSLEDEGMKPGRA